MTKLTLEIKPYLQSLFIMLLDQESATNLGSELIEEMKREDPIALQLITELNYNLALRGASINIIGMCLMWKLLREQGIFNGIKELEALIPDYKLSE